MFQFELSHGRETGVAKSFLTKLGLFRRRPDLVDAGRYAIKTDVNPDVFALFMTRLWDGHSHVEVTPENADQLRALCDELGFSGLDEELRSVGTRGGTPQSCTKDLAVVKSRVDRYDTLIEQLQRRVLDLEKQVSVPGMVETIERWFHELQRHDVAKFIAGVMREACLLLEDVRRMRKELGEQGDIAGMRALEDEASRLKVVEVKCETMLKPPLPAPQAVLPALPAPSSRGAPVRPPASPVQVTPTLPAAPTLPPLAPAPPSRDAPARPPTAHAPPVQVTPTVPAAPTLPPLAPAPPGSALRNRPRRRVVTPVVPVKTPQTQSVPRHTQAPTAYQLEYTEVGPLNGIIAHLTLECGGNVHEKGAVEVTASSVCGIGYEAKNAVELGTNSHFWSNCEPNSWICYDFQRRRVTPTSYSIRTDNCACPRSWVFEVSNDGSEGSWVVIDHHSDDVNAKSATCNFVISPLPRGRFRFVRVRQTRTNHDGNDILALSSLEVFGTLYA